MLIEAIPCVTARPVGARRVAQQSKQKRICLGCVPVLSVVDHGIEKLVELLAVEAAGERRDEVAEVRF